MSACPLRTRRRLRDECLHERGSSRLVVRSFRALGQLIVWGAALASIAPLWTLLMDDGSAAAEDLAGDLSLVGVVGAVTCLLVAYVLGRGLGKAEPALLWFANDRARWYLRRVFRLLPWTFVATVGVGFCTHLVAADEATSPIAISVMAASLPLLLLGWGTTGHYESADEEPGCIWMAAVLVLALGALVAGEGSNWRASIAALWLVLLFSRRAAICVGGRTRNRTVAGCAALVSTLVVLLGVPWLTAGSGHDHPVAPYLAGALAFWPWLIAVSQISAGARLVDRRGLLLEFEDTSDDEWTATDAELGRGHAAHPPPTRVVPDPEAPWIAAWRRFVDDLPSLRRKEWSDWFAGMIYGVLMTAFTVVGVAAAAFTVGLADSRPGLALAAIVVAATFARQVAPVDDEETLYLLGMDVVERERLALRMELTTATLAGVVAASLTAAWYGSLDAWIACALLAAALLFRAGLRGWVHDWTALVGFVAFGAAAVLTIVGAFRVHAWLLPVPILLGVAGVATVIGLIGIRRRTHARTEADWRSYLATERWEEGE